MSFDTPNDLPPPAPPIDTQDCVFIQPTEVLEIAEDKTSFGPVSQRYRSSQENPEEAKVLELVMPLAIHNEKVVAAWYDLIESGQCDDGKVYFLIREADGELLIARNESKLYADSGGYAIVALHMCNAEDEEGVD